jgi:hypothetical protein
MNQSEDVAATLERIKFLESELSAQKAVDEYEEKLFDLYPFGRTVTTYVPDEERRAAAAKELRELATTHEAALVREAAGHVCGIALKELMTSPPQPTRVKCPKCHQEYLSCHRPRRNLEALLQLDDSSAEHIEQWSTVTCDHCGHKASLDVMVLSPDWVWEPRP